MVWRFGEDKGFLSLAGIEQEVPGSQASILPTISTELTRLHAEDLRQFINLF